jgi:hypothetical protein
MQSAAWAEYPTTLISLDEGVGIRSEQVSPREAARRERERQRLLARPLVRALPELRAAAVAWTVAGTVAVLLALALGRIFYLTPIEYAALFGALFLPTAGSLAAIMLGRRTPTFMLYRLILDRAPAPPESMRREPETRTKRRAAVAAVALGIGLVPLIALLLAFAEAAMGRTRSEIPDHLAEEAVLVAGVYMLVSAGAARQVRLWIARWQEQRRAAALCPPLHSGLIDEIYFVEVLTPPPAPPSRGAGGSTPPAAP